MVVGAILDDTGRQNCCEMGAADQHELSGREGGPEVQGTLAG
jgi:hypothetical protein